MCRRRAPGRVRQICLRSPQQYGYSTVEICPCLSFCRLVVQAERSLSPNSGAGDRSQTFSSPQGVSGMRGDREHVGSRPQEGELTSVAAILVAAAADADGLRVALVVVVRCTRSMTNFVCARHTAFLFFSRRASTFCSLCYVCLHPCLTSCNIIPLLCLASLLSFVA